MNLSVSWLVWVEYDFYLGGYPSHSSKTTELPSIFRIPWNSELRGTVPLFNRFLQLVCIRNGNHSKTSAKNKLTSFDIFIFFNETKVFRVRLERRKIGIHRLLTYEILKHRTMFVLKTKQGLVEAYQWYFIVYEIFQYFNSSTNNILTYASKSTLCSILYVLECMK